MTVAYLNGEFQQLEVIRSSPLDRGLLFADGVYEVFPVYVGRPFRASAHLERLERSLDGIGIEDPLGRAGSNALLAGIIERNAGGHQAVSLPVGAITRDLLDGVSVGESAPGPLRPWMHRLLQDFKRRLISGDVD